MGREERPDQYCFDRPVKKLPRHNEKILAVRRIIVETASSREKLDIIETEYQIPAEEKRKDVGVICNLSQGTRDDEREKIIMNMLP